MNRTFSPLILFLFGFLVAPAVGQDADKIYPKSGTTATGKIVEINRNEVVAEIRGNKVRFPAADILRIVYESEHPELSRAKEQASGGQWEDAFESLKKVDAGSLTRDEAKREFEYYVGLVQCQLAIGGTGDAAAAEKRLVNYVGTNPQSFHFTRLRIRSVPGCLVRKLCASRQVFRRAGHFTARRIQNQSPFSTGNGQSRHRKHCRRPQSVH